MRPDAGGATACAASPRRRRKARLRGRRHSRRRDAAAIAHHYDVSNDFYRLVLGPSMTYSCAVLADAGRHRSRRRRRPSTSWCAASSGCEPGMRLLDVGCGWGGMVLHAAAHHGVRAVGVTLSRAPGRAAPRKRVADAGLADRVEIRLQDYRDVDDGPYDAISSIGMFEHVGLAQLGEYFARLHELLAPGRPAAQPRHQPARPASAAARFGPAQLHRPLRVPRRRAARGRAGRLAPMQRAGFEVRHVESLREHYALHAAPAGSPTSRPTGTRRSPRPARRRARVWRLYMAGSALGFEADRTQIHQVLAVRTERTGPAASPSAPTGAEPDHFGPPGPFLPLERVRAGSIVHKAAGHVLQEGSDGAPHVENFALRAELDVTTHEFLLLPIVSIHHPVEETSEQAPVCLFAVSDILVIVESLDVLDAEPRVLIPKPAARAGNKGECPGSTREIVLSRKKCCAIR